VLVVLQQRGEIVDRVIAHQDFADLAEVPLARAAGFGNGRDHAAHQRTAPIVPERLLVKAGVARQQRGEHFGIGVEQGAGAIEQVERVQAVGAARDGAEWIEEAHFLAHLAPAACGGVPRLALGIDDDHRAFEAQQIGDDDAAPLARAGGRDGHQVAVLAVKDGDVLFALWLRRDVMMGKADRRA
jgi:hypothetical protein